MSKKRIIRVVVGVLMLAALLFCIYRAMLAAPAPEEPAGETETVETEPPAESAEPSASAAPSPTPSPTPEPTPTPEPPPSRPDGGSSTGEVKVANRANNIGD